MNRSQLVEKLAIQEDLHNKYAEKIISTIFDAMAEAMIRNERVEIRGLGSFTIRNYSEYMGKNPKTGKPLMISPKKLPYFKVGKELKERILAS